MSDSIWRYRILKTFLGYEVQRRWHIDPPDKSKSWKKESLHDFLFMAKWAVLDLKHEDAARSARIKEHVNYKDRIIYEEK